jgi:hypothetical protein
MKYIAISKIDWHISAFAKRDLIVMGARGLVLARKTLGRRRGLGVARQYQNPFERF